MRAALLVAALVAVSSCGSNGQAGNTQNADESLTADQIVSNDVTAIDAVTGDAANMAADVDMNFGNLTESDNLTANEQAPRPAARKPAPKATPLPAETPANRTANAE